MAISRVYFRRNAGIPYMQASRRIDQPRPGYFKRRLVKNGWEVPGRICFEDGLWFAIVDGERYPPDPDPDKAQKVMWLWTSTEIEEGEYLMREAQRAYYRQTHPSHPIVNPTSRIIRSRLPPI
jgi:hypothetical protein